MKSLFDSNDREKIASRICALKPEAERQWGKMNLAQMLAHCVATLGMASGQMNLPRAFIGRVLGPLFRPAFLGETPFRHNAPTSPKLVVADTRTFEIEKNRLLQAITDFGTGGEAKCTRHPHPFFGKLTPEQWGIVQHKHIDHHLRQFGA
jgi:hypothetical protein